ncbi:sugar ABC transporter permease [Kribbella sp. NPDC000426]|uniref:carbohydrate ABC transporter permease n=1 Tax=Kribbella sp. NPDC000426 TaxID=3154255 RepID=UPI003325C824
MFLLPALVVFGYFSWWPIISSLLLSLQKTNLVTATWVGLDNFHRVFMDPVLPIAVRNTLWFFVLSLLIGFPIPLLLGMIGSELRRTGGLFRVLVYLPVVVPPVVSVLLWKWFYNPGSGLFNLVLDKIGLGPFPWLQDASWAMPSLVFEATWAGFGGSVLIYLAALAGVPSELYEAAEIDGASVPQRTWHVMLPQIRGVILLLLLLQMIGALQIFTEPYVMTDGGPANATITVLMLIYRYAFLRSDYGAAAALTVLLVVALGLLSAIYLRLTRRWSA